jgi:predicted transcriptional regulator YdeE
VLKIGDFAKLARVSVKTLRHYDKLGLLRPAWVDRWTSYRYYTLAQLPRLNRILALKDLGFSLEEVQLLLGEGLPPAELRGMLRLKRAELQRHLRTEQARLERVETRLRWIEREGELPRYEVVIKSVPARRVAGLRDWIPDYEHMKSLFSKLDGYVQGRPGVVGKLAPRFAIYYEVQEGDRGIDAEAALPVNDTSRAEPPMCVHDLPAVEAMACVVHPGEPDSLGEAYAAAMAWIEENGFRVAGPTREVYLPEPGQGQSVVDVQFPVERKPVSTFTLRAKERGEMEPKIVTKPAFSVVGMEYVGMNKHNEIKGMWDEFAPRMREIKHPDYSWGTYGICQGEANEETPWYLAGVEVTKVEDVPTGMVVWEIPQQTYAVFPCTLPTLHEAYRYAFEEWLPGSDYERVEGPDFELYTEEFDPDDPRMYIYVPVA